MDEADGSVTATLTSGTGYTVSTTKGSATVSVADDDDPPFAADASLVANVRSYIAETHHGEVHVKRWKQVLMGLCVENYAGLTAMKSSEAQTYSGKGWARWDPVVTELQKAEASNCTPPQSSQSAQQPVATPTPTPTPTPPTPEISIAASGDITEGGSATFTLTASPAPASDLSVSVTVSASGDYGVTAGSKTVTIPTGGSSTLTIPTTDDSVDETDGSVTAILAAGTGYTVSTTKGAATVSVSDDDVPEISVAASGDVTEGSGATFTLTASPAPASDLSVKVTVSASGDYGVTAGSQTVTISSSGKATLTVATNDDDVNESNGSVTATLSSGTGYTVSAAYGVATVAVADNDEAPAPEDSGESPTQDELIAMGTAVRDTYQASQDKSGSHWDVYYRMEEALRALDGQDSMANDPVVAPWHFRSGINSAKALGDDHAAQVFAQIRDFLGVEIVE